MSCSDKQQLQDINLRLVEICARGGDVRRSLFLNLFRTLATSLFHASELDEMNACSVVHEVYMGRVTKSLMMCNTYVGRMRKA
jgi:hypothetical protein